MSLLRMVPNYCLGQFIPAYNLISQDRGLSRSGFYRIGAALIPKRARPRLSLRPQNPEGRGRHQYKENVTFGCRAAKIFLRYSG
jgi:hypothetical protein